MTSRLLVLLLLSQAEEPDNPPDRAIKPPLSINLRPGAFASVGLGVEHAR
ncbi:hypothetical protein [Archangium sp.]|nr:hypothetical protein [Archangium sp.]